MDSRIPIVSHFIYNSLLYLVIWMFTLSQLAPLQADSYVLVTCLIPFLPWASTSLLFGITSCPRLLLYVSSSALESAIYLKSSNSKIWTLSIFVATELCLILGSWFNGERPKIVYIYIRKIYVQTYRCIYIAHIFMHCRNHDTNCKPFPQGSFLPSLIPWLCVPSSTVRILVTNCTLIIFSILWYI